MTPRRQPARFAGRCPRFLQRSARSGSSVMKNESCLLCEAAAFANGGKWTSESTMSTRTSARQLHLLVSRRERERSRKRGSHSHVTLATLCRRSGQSLECSVQCNSPADLLGRPSNAKWCKEWKGTKWSDVGLRDLVRPTLGGLILTCCDVADGTLLCVDTRADGREMCEN